MGKHTVLGLKCVSSLSHLHSVRAVMAVSCRDHSDCLIVKWCKAKAIDKT